MISLLTKLRGLGSRMSVATAPLVGVPGIAEKDLVHPTRVGYETNWGDVQLPLVTVHLTPGVESRRRSDAR